MKKKIINKINALLVIVIVGLLFIPSIIYILNNHYENMYLVIEKKVLEAGELCKNKNECESDEITLQELIDKKYIDKIYDPVSKELISNESYIDLDTKEFKIVS